MFYLNASFVFDPKMKAFLQNDFSRERGRYKALIRDLNRIWNSEQLI